MAAPLPPSRYQYCDANGVPLAGGTIATYVYGTSTPKDTWADQNESALNTNPVVLDAAGRCSMYGDGEYRLVLSDAAGNLIWDVYATTLVSAAMQPVVAAATIADARDLLGITDAIQVETDRALAAEANLQSQITAEVNRATAAENTLTTDLANEVTRAEAAEANLQTQIDAAANVSTFKSGSGVTDASGHTRIDYPAAFATNTIAVCMTVLGPTPEHVCGAVIDRFGFDAYIDIAGSGTGVGAAFSWIATGQ
jgi:hypothetical protein